MDYNLEIDQKRKKRFNERKRAASILTLESQLMANTICPKVNTQYAVSIDGKTDLELE